MADRDPSADLPLPEQPQDRGWSRQEGATPTSDAVPASDGAAASGAHHHRHHDGRFRFDDRLEERFERLEEAAIEAELATGRREETREQAKRHVLLRVARISLGVVVLLLGLLMLVLPGPGLVAILVGLTLLSEDVPFARRWVQLVRNRLPQDADGKLPKSTIVMMVVVAVAAMAGSIWFTMLR